MPKTAILDIDGTLVDTNYHHTLAWSHAFRQQGVVVPMWRIHRSIGMGGDQLVVTLTSQDFDDEHGDATRTAHDTLYMSLIRDVEPMHDARELVADLKRLGHTVVLASSAKEVEVDHYLDLLDVRDLADDWTTSDDVEATKPEPDLITAAIEKGGGGEAAMLGDTVWDIEAAKKAKVPVVALTTGGFSTAELEDAGAVAVFGSLAELRSGLSDTPLG
jgi:phosphoglycolate phosphatase-like HAD superfamily hydrolase